MFSFRQPLGNMTASEQTLRDRFAAVRPEEAGEGFWQVDFKSLGSVCGLFYEAAGPAEAEAYCRAALQWLARFEAKWSRYLTDSHLSLINQRAGGEWTDTDQELEVLLDLCGHYHFSTRGIFDATSLPLSRLWDWRRAHPVLPGPDAVAAALALVGWEKVEREKGRVRLSGPGMELDLGGVGKEFAVDCVAGLAAGFGISTGRDGHDQLDARIDLEHGLGLGEGAVAVPLAGLDGHQLQPRDTSRRAAP